MAKHWNMGTDFNLSQVEQDALGATIDMLMEEFSKDLARGIHAIKDQLRSGKVEIDVVVRAVEAA